ncbi:hypothetical protein [Oceaniradius stylonematis]|uniref:hypothetical protein n=1 Tax=Oceaniradius stylonematis TaxID=2184161 RepID=UPI003C7BBCBA
MMHFDLFELLPDRMRGKSHYIVSPRWCGGFLIEIRRAGYPPETVFCETRGAANRARQALSDAGFIGFVREG